MNHIMAVINNELELVVVCDVLPDALKNLLKKHGLEKDGSI